MKRSGFLLLAGLTILCGQLHAQNKNQEMSIELQTPGARPTVTLNYQTKTMEDGNTVMDGPFSIDFPLQTIENNGLSAEISYMLKGSFKDGWFNGPIEVRQTYAGDHRDEWGDIIENYRTEYFLDGNFKEGIPDGAWNYRTDIGEFQGTFDNGDLTGNYTYYNIGMDDKCSGTYNGNGHLEGKCTTMDGFVTYDFHDGILLQKNDLNDGNFYNNEIAAYARKYAEGKISVADLEKEDIYIYEEIICTVAANFKEMLVSEQLLPWEQLHGMKDDSRFEGRKCTRSQILGKRMTLADKGLDNLLKEIAEEKDHIWSVREQNIYPGRYYFTVEKEDLGNYKGLVKKFYDSGENLQRIYLTTGQSAKVEEKLQERRIAKNGKELNAMAMTAMRLFKSITDEACKAALPEGGPFDRALYESKIAEIIGKDKQVLADSLGAEDLSIGRIISILQKYGPFTQYEMGELKAEPMSFNYTKDVRIIRDDPSGYGFDEFTSRLKLFQIGTMIRLQCEDSFLDEETEQIPNDWHKVWELQDTIRNNDQTIFQMVARPDLSRLFQKVELKPTELPEPVKNVEESISGHQRLVTRQKFQIRYLKKCAELMQADSRIRSEIADIENIRSPYINWFEALGLDFIPDEESMKRLADVRAQIINCLEYTSGYKRLISGPDGQVREKIKNFPNLREPYEEWFSKQDLVWEAGKDNTKKLPAISKTMERANEFADYYITKVAVAEEDIITRADTLGNIMGPYKSWLNSQKIDWNSDPESIRHLETIFSVQTSCQEFIKNYLEVSTASKKIMKGLMKEKRLSKFYENWYNTLNFNWSPAPERNKMFDSIGQYQEIFLTAIRRNTLKDLDKVLKKSKAQNMSELKAAMEQPKGKKGSKNKR